MHKITMGKKKPIKRREPDYYCQYKDEYTAQFLNRDIWCYEIRIDGKYKCTVHLKKKRNQYTGLVESDPTLLRQLAIIRFKELKPIFRATPDNEIQTILTASL